MIAGDGRDPPSSNLKRFSSLENLSSAMYEQENDNSTSFDDDGEGDAQPRMARKRGGNESFRAAVDRSYDPVPVAQLEMEPCEYLTLSFMNIHARLHPLWIII